MRVPSWSVAVAALAWSACGPAARPAAQAPAEAARPPAPTVPACAVRERVISAPGVASVRPDVASGDGGFAAVWEETDVRHRGVHFLALDGAAQPLAGSVEIADLDRGGAEPRVTADGDGFAVLWTVDEADTSVIAFRRVDGRGKPRGDVAPAVSAPGARALAVERLCGVASDGGAGCDDGFALAWWTWAGAAPQQSITWLDGDGRPHARLPLASGAFVDPAVALRRVDARLVASWEELVEGRQHVFAGELTRGGIAARADLGVGDGPSLGAGRVVYANLGEASVWSAPLDPGGGEPAPVGDGQVPSAAARGDSTVACFARSRSTEESSEDELACRELDGPRAGRETTVARAPLGIVSLRVAAGPSAYGVVYQIEEDGGMTVHFATVRCP
jgi:hypothetical protein